MNKTTLTFFLMTIFGTSTMFQIVQATEGDTVYRRSNFSNEFKISTPEGINAKGYAEVESTGSLHNIKIHVDGLLPNESYVLLNHWMEPVPERGVPDSAGALVDPSCNGHTQTLSVQSDNKGMIDVRQLAINNPPKLLVFLFAFGVATPVS